MRSYLFVLGPSDTDAPRTDLTALHLLDGHLCILLMAEGNEAIALGPSRDVVPHNTSVPAPGTGKMI